MSGAPIHATGIRTHGATLIVECDVAEYELKPEFEIKNRKHGELLWPKMNKLFFVIGIIGIIFGILALIGGSIGNRWMVVSCLIGCGACFVVLLIFRCFDHILAARHLLTFELVGNKDNQKHVFEFDGHLLEQVRQCIRDVMCNYTYQVQIVRRLV